MKLPIKGGCACKRIRYSCSVEPLIMLNCNCRNCQYASGNGHSTIFGVPLSALKIQGEVKYYESKSDKGNTVQRGFCAECGTPLFNTSETAKEFIGIKAGTLDASPWFKPSLDVWTASVQPWDVLSPDTTKFEYDPQF